jgi:DNA-binding Lrp family transcriptional regulator
MDKLFVLIKVQPGRIEQVLSTIVKSKYIAEAAAVTGSYDVIVKIEGAKIAEILSTVVREIQKIDGIVSTETLVAVDF